MSQVTRSGLFVNAEAPADPNYSPLPVGLPDELMQPAPPPVDAAAWPQWNAVLALLPFERRKRIYHCRRTALHIRKQTANGSVDSVNAIACGDRVACPRCATRYAHERAWSAASKLAVVSHTAGTAGARVRLPIHVLEFSAIIPEWNAAVKVKGCIRSETIGRLCIKTARCHECIVAGKAHARAAEIESFLARWIQAAWLALRPLSGGVRHTRVEQDSPGAPIRLVVTLFVPAVAVQTYRGPKVALAAAQRRHFQAIEATDAAALREQWQAHLAEIGAVGTLTGEAPTEWPEIWASFRRVHAPALAGWAKTLGTSLVTPDVAHTFARAAGLGSHGGSGKARRVQRSAWFGIFTGPRKGEVLNCLHINVVARTPEAKAEVIDVVKILAVGEQEVTAQSYRTGEVVHYSRSIVRLDRCVNATGKPEGEIDDVEWEHEASLNINIMRKIGKIERKNQIACGQITNSHKVIS